MADFYIAAHKRAEGIDSVKDAFAVNVNAGIESPGPMLPRNEQRDDGYRR